MIWKKNFWHYVLIIFVWQTPVLQSATFDNPIDLMPDDTTKIHRLLEQTEQLLQSAPAQAYHRANQAAQLSEKLDFAFGHAKSVLFMATSLAAQNNYAEAGKLFEQVAEEVSKNPKTKRWYRLQTKVFEEQGIMFRVRGDSDKALENFIKSLKISEINKDNLGIARSSNLIGELYYGQKSYDKALGYLNAALTMSYKVDAPVLIADNLHDLGQVYAAQGYFEKSLANHKKSIKIRKNNKLLKDLGMSYSSMGEVFAMQNSNDQALLYYFKSLSIYRKTENYFGLANNCIKIGQLCYKIEDYDKAIEYFSEALSIGQTIKALNIIRDAAFGLSQAHSALNHFEFAYNNYIIYKTMSDSLLNVEKVKNIAQLEMQYEYEKQEQAKTIKQQRRDFILLVSGAIMVLVIGLISLLYIKLRTKHKISKLQQKQLNLEQANLKGELEIKNKELATNVMYLIRKNELINDIAEQLIRAKGNLRRENQRIVTDIIRELQTGADDDIWREFEIRFQQVHRSFYNNLMEKFPKLSPNEKKLCAFLRLNMSTKDIAALTRKSTSSIDVARTRLRKKLEISGTDTNLISFLAKL